MLVLTSAARQDGCRVEADAISASSSVVEQWLCQLDKVYDGEATVAYGTWSQLDDADMDTFEKLPDGYGESQYGEVAPRSLAELLIELGARPADRFYDLGAGAGKVVVLAWLMVDKVPLFKCYLLTTHVILIFGTSFSATYVWAPVLCCVSLLGAWLGFLHTAQTWYSLCLSPMMILFVEIVYSVDHRRG